MNPYKISNQGSRITKNQNYKQTTLQVHRIDQTDIKFDDFKIFVDKLL